MVKLYTIYTKNIIYQVENNIVFTLLGVVVPVKKIVNVCIKPVALAFILVAILENSPNDTIVILVPFTVIALQLNLAEQYFSNLYIAFTAPVGTLV